MIQLPTGVTLSVNANNVITVKGKRGELSQQVDKDIH